MDKSATRTRRSVLAGGAGALLATVAAASARHLPALAGSDGDVVLGSTNESSQTTRVRSSVGNEVPALQGDGTAPDTGVGVGGTGTWVGVRGEAAGSGVYGYSKTGIGVTAVTEAELDDREISALRAVSTMTTAVHGDSTRHIGVHGHTMTGVGVFAQADDTGTALVAMSELGHATAIHSYGRVQLDFVSGVARIATGRMSVSVTPVFRIDARSFVLLTPRTNLGGRALWFALDTKNNRFLIKMSSPRQSATPIAWLLLGG